MADVSPDALVCRGSEIEGDVSLGAGTVVHPSAKIIAEAGFKVVIGENNVICEQCIIHAKDANVSIGNTNYFHVGSHCIGATVGNNNVFEAKSSVVSGVTVGSHCFIGAKCAADEDLPDRTILFGDNQKRSDPSYNMSTDYAVMREHLMKTLPSFHPAQKF